MLALAIFISQGFDLIMASLTTDLGWGREVFVVVIALKNTVWDLTQHLAGGVADSFVGDWIAHGAA